jgi:hypothetical protein
MTIDQLEQCLANAQAELKAGGSTSAIVLGLVSTLMQHEIDKLKIWEEAQRTKHGGLGSTGLE